MRQYGHLKQARMKCARILVGFHLMRCQDGNHVQVWAKSSFTKPELRGDVSSIRH